jgi:hypothetical protein
MSRSTKRFSSQRDSSGTRSGRIERASLGRSPVGFGAQPSTLNVKDVAVLT